MEPIDADGRAACHKARNTMGLYQTTPEQRIRLYQIAADMAQSGLSAAFVAGAVELASDSEGIYDLMELWSEEESDEERGEILSDIRGAINEMQGAPDAALGTMRDGRVHA